MAKGGARAHSGPPPDPDALRRDRDGGEWVTLSAAGREGEPPEWPLTNATDRETALWAREWKRPQAVKWEELGLELEVALYVRSLSGAERQDAAVNLRTLVKQQQEALGISLPGLARNKWRIGTVDAAAVSSRRVSAGTARARFKVIDGAGGE